MIPVSMIVFNMQGSWAIMYWCPTELYFIKFYLGGMLLINLGTYIKKQPYKMFCYVCYKNFM